MSNPDKTTPNNKAEDHSITAKLERLDQAVEWFYGEDFALDQAIDKYKAAVELSQEIDHDLNELENQVEVLADFTK